MLARIDDDLVAFGANPGIDAAMSNLGLIVSGTTASFKDLVIWEAKPNPDWAAHKAKLAAATR
jgi:hypothetical protein